MLHRGDRRTLTTKKVRETEAEAVAFVICNAIGLQNGTSSADYVVFAFMWRSTLVGAETADFNAAEHRISWRDLRQQHQQSQNRSTGPTSN